MVGRWRAPVRLRDTVLLFALGALLGCACVEPSEAQGLPGAAVSAAPGHAHAAPAHGLHADCCRGVKPEPTGAPAPVPALRAAPAAWAPPPASCREPGVAAPVPRLALFIRHASLLI